MSKSFIDTVSLKRSFWPGLAGSMSEDPHLTERRHPLPLSLPPLSPPSPPPCQSSKLHTSAGVDVRGALGQQHLEAILGSPLRQSTDRSHTLPPRPHTLPHPHPPTAPPPPPPPPPLFNRLILSSVLPSGTGPVRGRGKTGG